MSDLKISLVQCDLAWQEPNKNRKNIGELIRQSIDETDLILLPEMFTTGFAMNPSECAEPFSKSMETISWMKEISAAYSCSIAGSVAIEENGHFYNRIIWVNPSGDVLFYDKKHLFSLTGENVKYEPGNQKIILEIRDWKIAPFICYDLRFPEWSRNNIVNGEPEYDIVFYLANWPNTRIEQWDSLLKARAIENQSYSVGVNRTGEDKNNLTFSGESVAYDFTGIQLIRPVKNTSHVHAINLQKEPLKTYRKSFPFLMDQK